MQKFIGPAIALIILALGIFYKNPHPTLLGSSTDANPSIQPQTTPTSEVISDTTNPTSTPTPKPFPSITPTPTPTQPSSPIQDQFFYPGSSTIFSNQSTLTLSSSDESDLITAWYKNKIKSLGLSATSFVTTSANDNIINKLVGSGNGQEVRIEITKSSKKQNTTISISLN